MKDGRKLESRHLKYSDVCFNKRFYPSFSNLWPHSFVAIGKRSEWRKEGFVCELVKLGFYRRR